MCAILTLSTLGLAWLLHRSLKRVGAALDAVIDEAFTFGDVPHIPDERRPL